MDDKHPGRASRRAFLALGAVLVATGVAYLALPLDWFAFVIPFTLVGALLSLMLGLIFGDQAKGRARMERGEGVVAKWSLTSTEWTEFVKLNKGTITIPTLQAQPPVEIVFAENAVYVDGNFYTMDRAWGTNAAMHPSPGGTVYIELGQGGLDDYSPIRIPVPDRDHGKATKVVAYFKDPAGR